MNNKAGKQKIQETRQIQETDLEENKWQLKENSEFNPVYCRKLVEHCSRGYSFQSFAAIINVVPELLEEWTKKYPEFSKARYAAALKQKVFWEKKAVEACSKKFSISVFRYFVGSKTENPAVPGPVVVLPEEENSKEE